ncbi:tetratricopeptide repeat protein [Pedobacter namyangjuensis]|uniref:tetratricopeptide repeat protein n=1 Tax=Pedobacter namyangjuensis TaxID=600626 RepID=UPI000DE4CF00|nr:tetratricopeptide repeat protein [Pedobacter namyangjuensis]
MNYLKNTFLFLFTVSISSASFAQSNFEKMGTQAYMKSDYKGAVAQLEKASSGDPNNAKVLKMLGYSYFQCADYESAIDAYSRLITVKPDDFSAYYYRGKARLNIANAPKESLNQMRESFYLSAIKDFTKALSFSGEEEVQILQNRGIAYKDYAIFKSYKIKKGPEKTACVALFNNATADFQKVLTVYPLKKDIIALVDYVKAQVTSLK